MARATEQRLSTLVCVSLVLLILSACQNVLNPLGQADPQLAQEPAEAGPVLLRIATCWPALPLVEDLTTAFLNEDTNLSLDIVPGNSQAARELVAAGQADMAFVEQTTAEDSSADSVLALNVVGIIVHKDAGLDQITSAKLAALFAGEVLDWAELGAGIGHVEIVSQGNGAVAQRLFEAQVMGGKAVSSAAVVMPHDRGVLDYVAEHPGAIGYLSTAYVDGRVKLVALDDVLPTSAEIKRGRYPLTCSLLVRTSPKAPREAARLLAFALSNRGKQIIEQRYTVAR
jgi:phosphate transport system substrate-binding protein